MRRFKVTNYYHGEGFFSERAKYCDVLIEQGGLTEFGLFIQMGILHTPKNDVWDRKIERSGNSKDHKK